MKSSVTLAIAQLDLTVGDVAGNTAKILEYSNRAGDEMQIGRASCRERV